jgi:hypothetical protein
MFFKLILFRFFLTDFVNIVDFYTSNDFVLASFDGQVLLYKFNGQDSDVENLFGTIAIEHYQNRMT